MDDAVTERGEEVLAVHRHAVEHVAVDERGAGEPSLRAADVDRQTGELAPLGAGQPVQRVTLRHQIPAALPILARGSATAAKTPSRSTVMTLACPNPESNGGATSTVCPRSISPVRHSAGA